MSWNPTHRPDCERDDDSPVETLIIPRARDIGQFAVRRALPARERQMVGPFIFFDEMGPVELLTNEGVDIRPHPHIGLATVTYLLNGELHHRDSLGTDQIIRPGAVNWMVAGRGITHSERSSAEVRKKTGQLFGIQTWVALPEDEEDNSPTFVHVGADELPVVDIDGASIRVILGDGYGESVSVGTRMRLLYADVYMPAGSTIPLPDDHEDRGIYVLNGEIAVRGTTYDRGKMMVFRPGDPIQVTAGEQGARLLLLGGDTMSSPRYIWWNFVSSSREKIIEAQRQWSDERWDDGMFKLPPGDDEEFVPMHGRPRFRS